MAVEMNGQGHADEVAIAPEEIWSGIAALLAAPVVLPMAAAINQPLVRSVLTDAIAFSERCHKAVAVAQEQIEDGLAEIQAGSQTARYQSPSAAIVGDSAPASQVAGQLQATAQDWNAQMQALTGGQLDLRMLLSMGLGAIALRQLMRRGLQLDDMPWYVMAWYAFDTFVKLHPVSAQTAAYSAATSPSSAPQPDLN
ncbi:MAG: DUF5132 domain-containing protein [Cyanobacteria bacterium J06554_6]